MTTLELNRIKEIMDKDEIDRSEYEILSDNIELEELRNATNKLYEAMED